MLTAVELVGTRGVTRKGEMLSNPSTPIMTRLSRSGGSQSGGSASQPVGAGHRSAIRRCRATSSG